MHCAAGPPPPFGTHTRVVAFANTSSWPTKPLHIDASSWMRPDGTPGPLAVYGGVGAVRSLPIAPSSATASWLWVSAHRVGLLLCTGLCHQMCGTMQRHVRAYRRK